MHLFYTENVSGHVRHITDINHISLKLTEYQANLQPDRWT